MPLTQINARAGNCAREAKKCWDLFLHDYFYRIEGFEVEMKRRMNTLIRVNESKSRFGKSDNIAMHTLQTPIQSLMHASMT